MSITFKKEGVGNNLNKSLENKTNNPVLTKYNQSKPTAPVTNKPINQEIGVPKKISVFVISLLSIITLGIYPYIWYIKRSSKLNNLRTEHKSKSIVPKLSLVVYIIMILSAIGLFVIAAIEDIGIDVSNISDVPLSFTILFFTILALGIIEILLLIIMSFQVRKILNQALVNKGEKRKVSGFFTLIYNFTYLQYEINRIIDDKENEKRLGPIIWLIILIIGSIAGSIIPYVMNL